jgi:hypothetical protein
MAANYRTSCASPGSKVGLTSVRTRPAKAGGGPEDLQAGHGPGEPDAGAVVREVGQREVARVDGVDVDDAERAGAVAADHQRQPADLELGGDGEEK